KVYGGLRPPANLPLRFSAENSVDGRRRAAAQKALAGNGGQSTIGLASLLMGRMAWQRKAAQWPLGRLFLTPPICFIFLKHPPHCVLHPSRRLRHCVRSPWPYPSCLRLPCSCRLSTCRHLP